MVAAASPSAPASPTTHIGHESGTPVIMPHVELSETELRILHPKLEAPDEVLSADAADDLDDTIYQYGLKIARDIQQHAVEHGRLRHAEVVHETPSRPCATPTASSTTGATTTTTAPTSSTTTTPARPTTTSAPTAPASPSTARACSLEASASALLSVRSVAGGVFSDSVSSRSRPGYFSIPIVGASSFLAEQTL